MATKPTAHHALTASHARADLPAAVRRAEHGHRSVIENRGRPVAAIVSIEDLALIERLEDEIDLAEVRRRSREASIPWTTIRERMGL